MATAIGLSMQLSASTSGLTSGLSEADKLINKLGRGAESAAQFFDKFRDATTGELPAAMQSVADSAGQLTESFRSGASGSEEFTAGMTDVVAQAQFLTKAFQEGAAITAQFTTEEEKRAAKLDRLVQLQDVGAIGAETYARALAEASGANAEAAKAEQEMAAAKQRAAQITEASLSAQEKYDREIQELQTHLDAGRISQETFNTATEKAQAGLARAGAAAKGAGGEAEKAGLQFSELSGVFSLLPGPLGTIAGRISSFTSAGTGLAKLFSGGGGLTGAMSGLAGSVTALINPFTLAAAAIIGFGTAVSGISKGLISLEDRVEKLGNQADKLGASFQFIQVLETSAERSGNSIGGLSSSFNKFLRAVDEAKNGSDKTVEAFAKIGISADDLKSKKPEEIYKAMALGIVAVEDPAARAGVAMALLGRSGLDLIPTFKQISQSEADLQKFFAVLSDVDRINLDAFGASVDSLVTATRGLGQAILLPFVGLATGVTAAGAEFTGAITAIVEPIGNLLGPALSQIGAVVEAFATGLALVARTVGVLAQALEPVAQFLLPAVVAQLIAMNAAAIAGGIRSLVTTLASAAVSAIAYTASAGFATAATVALGAAIQVALASTGVGLLVVGLGLAGLALYNYFTGADEAAEKSEELAASLGKVGDASTQFNSEITKAVEATKGLGAEGFDAALKYQNALQDLADLAAEGELNDEQLARAVAQTTAAFEASIQPLQAAQKAREDAAKAAEQAAKQQVDADKKIADQFIKNQQIEQQFGGNKERAAAAESLLAIEREIGRVQAEQAAAAGAGDAASAAAATARLAALDQAQAALRDTAEFGFNQRDVDKAIEKVRAGIEKSVSDADIQLAPDAASDFFDEIKDLERQLDLKIIDPKQFEEASQAAQKTFDKAKDQAKKINDLQNKFDEERSRIQNERLDELAKVSQQSLQANDVRSSAGASEFLRLATGREDPAIEESRKQFQKLEEIRKEIAKANQQPVEMI